MGFESLYVAIRTITVHFFGVAGGVDAGAPGCRQIVVMVGALALQLAPDAIATTLQAMLLIGMSSAAGYRRCRRSCNAC